MESISKIQLRLYAAKRKNGKWQLEMSRMPKRISVIGRTPIVDEHYMPSDLEVVSMSKLHKYVGSYYGKIVKTLKEEGIITKECGNCVKTFRTRALRYMSQAGCAASTTSICHGHRKA